MRIFILNLPSGLDFFQDSIEGELIAEHTRRDKSTRYVHTFAELTIPSSPRPQGQDGLHLEEVSTAAVSVLYVTL